MTIDWDIINKGWFGIVAGLVISIVTGVYFLRKSKQRTALSVEMLHTIIIAPSEPDDRLEVRYDGAPVPRVTKSVAGFWNSGNQVIRRDDISARDPVALRCTESARILQVRMLAETREVIWARHTVHDDSEILIDFDFLNPEDGFTIEVLHTGQWGAISPAGTIKGMDREIGAPKPARRFFRIFGIGMVAGMALIMFAAMALMIGMFGYFIWTVPFPKNLIFAVAIVGMAWIIFSESTTTHEQSVPGAPEAVSKSMLTSAKSYRGVDNMDETADEARRKLNG